MGFLRPGDRFSKFSASDWNDVLAHQRRAAARDLRHDGAEDGDSALDGVVQFKNDTGRYLSPGFVVGLSEPFITASANPDEYRNTINFKGISPTAEHKGKFGIVLDGGGPDAILPACIWGPAWAKVLVNDESHQFVECVADDPTKLETVGGGSTQLLHFMSLAQTVPYETVGYVRIGNRASSAYIFKTPDATESEPDGIPAATYDPAEDTLTAGSRELTVWEFNSDDVLIETEQVETVYNIALEAVGARKYIQAKRECRTGRLVVDFEDCTDLPAAE